MDSRLDRWCHCVWYFIHAEQSSRERAEQQNKNRERESSRERSRAERASEQHSRRDQDAAAVVVHGRELDTAGLLTTLLVEAQRVRGENGKLTSE